MVMHRRDIVRLSLLAITAFYCVLPLVIHDGLPYAQDIIVHAFQADQFVRAVGEGVFYPRWLPDYSNGYGSATFIFYAPLVYYVATAIKLFTSSLTTAMIATIWLAFFLSGVTMFAATKRIFGGTGSVLPALIYEIIPFHLGDLYIRGTFAELFAYAWFPLIVLFAYETMESGNRRTMLGLSVSYAGLILTHLASGFIFSCVLGIYIIYHFLFLKHREKAVKALLSLSLGLGLSSVYLIPVIFERKFVQIEYLITCLVGDYRKNFLFTWDKFEAGLLSFYLPLHLMIALEVILFLCIVGLMRSDRQKLPNIPQQNLFMFVFVFAFFLTTPLTMSVWSVMPGFPSLQFPWRWTPVMELSLCLLVGAVFSAKDMAALGPAAFRRAIIYCLITVFLASFAMIAKSTVIPDKAITGILKPERIRSLVDPPVEYTPVWVHNIREIMSEKRNEKVLVISGQATAAVVEWKSERRVIGVKVLTPSLVRISTFYYPGWKAEIDGAPVLIRIERKSGAMLIDVPRGWHTLTLRFEDTPLRHYAKLISVFALCVVVLLFVFKKEIRVRR